ncbi:WD40-repeat-containing domain protein [Polychytrium aggregatum]|uniref:WD40-repeat-containing domain protein n=1 Tax=Polychytrium aggregatum TaxID=110093 RepID=UPI0022FE4F2A|nr:WD40-repeat-containing domain protein [Polychytrium aggregatum]KAI9205808.1 WD40-repeat-containing domain protein [Polychytrium aggregatum]
MQRSSTAAFQRPSLKIRSSLAVEALRPASAINSTISLASAESPRFAGNAPFSINSAPNGSNGDDRELGSPAQIVVRVQNEFPKFSAPDRQKFILAILKECDPSDMTFLYKTLPVLHRDFLKLLPAPISHRILSYVHPRDFCVVIRVSRAWFRTVTDPVLWALLYDQIGLSSMTNSYYIANAPLLVNAKKLHRLSSWTRGRFTHRRFLAHQAGILGIWFNGQWVATGSVDKSCTVHHVSNGKLVKRYVGHEESVYCVQFDEAKVITGSADCTVRIWGAKDGGQRFILRGHKATINCLKFNSDNLLVTGSSDKTLRIWQMPNNAIILSTKIKRTETTDEQRLMLIQGGERAAPAQQRVGSPREKPGSAGLGRSASTVNPNSNSKLRTKDKSSTEPGTVPTQMEPTCLRTLHGHVAGVKCLDFTSAVLVSGDIHGFLRLWHIRSGNLLKVISIAQPSKAINAFQTAVPPAASDDPISSIQFTGTRLVFGAFSGNLYMYDVLPHKTITSAVTTNQLSAAYEHLHHWANDPATFVLNRVFNLQETMSSPTLSHAASSAEVRPLSPTPDRRKTKRRNGERYPASKSGATSSSSSFSKPGNLEISVSREPSLPSPLSSALPSPLAFAASPLAKIKSQKLNSWALCVQMDEWRLMSGGSGGRCSVWNYRTGRQIYVLKGNIIDNGDGPIQCETKEILPEEALDFAGDGNTEEGKTITGVAFDDRYIVAGGMDGMVRIWEAKVN